MGRAQKTHLALVAVVLLIAGFAVTFHKNQNINEQWREVRERVLPQFIPAQNKTLIPLVTREFSSTVDIGFVIDGEEKYDFINPAMLASYEITAQKLYDTAMKNLDARSKNISVEVAQASEGDDSAKYVIVELDDGYAAVRMLSAGVRRAIARELGGEYIAAIPTRDFLIFWHKEFPLFEAFQKQVQVEFSAEKNYPLTATLFRVNQFGIQAVTLEKNNASN